MLITVTVGIYSVTWIFQFLYNMAERKEIPVITASMTKLPNGADANHSIIFNFQENGAQGIATTSLIYSDDPDKSRSAGPAIRIQGTHGEVQLWPPAYRPEKCRIVYNSDNNSPEELESGLVDDRIRQVREGRGMYWEADECAKCIRDGRKEREGMPLDETIVIMKTLDEIRKQCCLTYPDGIESLDYPPERL